MDRAHLHVVRREDNPNGAWAKSRRQRVVPLDFLTVLAFDTYQLERSAVAAAADSDFVLVNLFRPPVGAPMRLDAINELTGAASRRAGIDPPVRPHQLRHAFGSNVADAGNGIDVVADCSVTGGCRRRRCICIPIRPGSARRWTACPARSAVRR